MWPCTQALPSFLTGTQEQLGRPRYIPAPLPGLHSQRPGGGVWGAPGRGWSTDGDLQTPIEHRGPPGGSRARCEVEPAHGQSGGGLEHLPCGLLTSDVTLLFPDPGMHAGRDLAFSCFSFLSPEEPLKGPTHVHMQPMLEITSPQTLPNV